MYIEPTNNAGEEPRYAIKEITEEELQIFQSALYAFISRAEDIRPDDNLAAVQKMVNILANK